MRRTVSGLVVAALLTFAVAAPVGATTAISGGNDVSARPSLDSYSNFVIVDRNNPISGAGVLTSWSFWAGATSGVNLVVVRAATVVAMSPMVTPSTTGVAVTTALSPALPVQAGDYVGLYFASTGVVPFSGIASGGTSGTVLYTANGSGVPAVGGTLTKEGEVDRIYSVSVSGIVPGSHEKTDLVPYPTGSAVGAVIFNSSAGNPNNLELTVQLKKVTPDTTYDIYIYLDQPGTSINGFGHPLATLTTNGVGNGTVHVNATIPEGIHTVGVDVVLHGDVNGYDVYVTPGLYGQNLFMFFK